MRRRVRRRLFADSSAAIGSRPRVRDEASAQPSTQPPHGSCLSVDTIERAAIDVRAVDRNIEAALHLGCRSSRVSQEATELESRSTVKAFGNVVHRRDRRTFQLIAEHEVPTQRLSIDDLVHLAGESPRLTPCLQILEPTHEPHGPPPHTPRSRLTGSPVHDHIEPLTPIQSSPVAWTKYHRPRDSHLLLR